jgi:hypothetical protein
MGKVIDLARGKAQLEALKKLYGKEARDVEKTDHTQEGDTNRESGTESTRKMVVFPPDPS